MDKVLICPMETNKYTKILKLEPIAHLRQALGDALIGGSLIPRDAA